VEERGRLIEAGAEECNKLVEIIAGNRDITTEVDVQD
jgi:hypothetical protein